VPRSEETGWESVSLTFGSLFTGVGGFDLGFERAGMLCKWQCESSDSRRELLGYKFPGVTIHDDVRTCKPEAVDVLCGGDPCPKHSRARSNGDSKHPDLSGYFLSLVGRLRPRWVVRENVPAPTVDWFAAALEILGYGCVVIRIDAATITGQSRQRDFTVGCNSLTGSELARTVFSDCQDGPGPYTTRLGTRPITPALTTHRTRYDSRDCYVWTERYGLRILESEERERLAGFPHDWTAGFSAATRAAMLGNALVPAKAEWIGRRIIKSGS
jgi:DNA (cytosine-5)-methyltransferase 1